ncbi:MAG: glycosyltransferase family 39 protein, partial [Coriobacteriales bacterium]|nr:glycosyltransferase family 39 protein [Coriobacteriales bacterium]
MFARLREIARDAWLGRLPGSDPAVIRLVLFAGALIVFKAVAQIAVGPAWDSFSFLANAAQFAGLGYGYTEPARPPMISLITSVPMRLGFTDAAVIQVVDSGLTALALAGLYLVLRRRFDRQVSSVAVLAFLVAPPVWKWVGVGYTDLAATGLCLLALFFAIKATEDDPRWYVAVFPTLLAATLMRTTSLLFVGVLGVWLLLRCRPLRHARFLMAGVATAIASYVPLGWYYEATVGNALYPLVASMRVQEAAKASRLSGLERPVESFVRSLPSLAAPSSIDWLSLALLGAAGLGLLVSGVVFVARRRPGAGRVVLAMAAVAVTAKAILGRGPAAVLIVAGCTYLVWRLLLSEEQRAEGGPVRIVAPTLALDATMVSWLIGLLAFHEQWAQRVERYYIAMAPALVYLAALGLLALVRTARRLSHVEWPSMRAVSVVGAVVPAAVVVALLVGGAIDVLATDRTNDRTVADSIKTAQWLRTRGFGEGSVVYSDTWPQTSWYLKAPVKAMPGFDDRRAVEHELAKNRADYYVTVYGGTDLDGFDVGADTGATRVLVAGRRVATARPRVQYLGAGWENYLEKLTGFGFYLDHDEGDYNMQGSAFLDEYSLEYLKRYKVVAVYGAKWRNRSKAERLMMEYARQGGTIVLDASANLAQPYSLQDCALFDTVLARTPIPAYGRIEVSDALT